MQLKCLSILMFLGLVVFVNSCSDDESDLVGEVETRPEEIGYENVDEALWVYFERFEEEAAERGLIIDLNESEIVAMIGPLEGENVAGQCTYSTAFPNEVVLDEAFWEAASDAEKEMVVFHELGHCQLARAHREDVNSRNQCVSIMNSGTINCRIIYVLNREAYLDELFDEMFFDTIGG